MRKQTNYLFILTFYKGAKCGQKVENYYNCEIWNMDVYKPYFNATERAKKNIFNVDKMQFIEKKLLTTRYIISSGFFRIFL
jgi:hypothetical protein